MPEIRVPETAFQAYPTHRIFGIVDQAGAADRVIAGLATLGLGSDLWILTGTAGNQVLDPEGTEHGAYAWLVRSIQKLGYEGAQMREYEEASSAGSWVISAQLDDTGSQKEVVRDLFAQHGGRNVRYLGPLGIVDLHHNASGG